jgi:hypothetical protein
MVGTSSKWRFMASLLQEFSRKGLIENQEERKNARA